MWSSSKASRQLAPFCQWQAPPICLFDMQYHRKVATSHAQGEASGRRSTLTTSILLFHRLIITCSRVSVTKGVLCMTGHCKRSVYTSFKVLAQL